jgi:hypothetical protein
MRRILSGIDRTAVQLIPCGANFSLQRRLQPASSIGESRYRKLKLFRSFRRLRRGLRILALLPGITLFVKPV